MSFEELESKLEEYGFTDLEHQGTARSCEFFEGKHEGKRVEIKIDLTDLDLFIRSANPFESNHWNGPKKVVF